ncbi:MAG: pyridoxal-phosphate dependent enzyme [Actinomycetia bacterium]|nr:pyridoxal-phosphate dependent enzyme [Actinomycetes bacterium]
MSTIPTEREGINGLDRATLCALPTPLVEAKRLAESLGRTRLFIKRDDLTGLALGGNKPRACEFVMGQAKASGHDVVIAVGPQHSNQLCAIAAAAKKCGMPAILLLLRGDDRVRGNLLLFRILGAEVRFTHVDPANIEEAYDQMEALADHLQKEGARPYKLRYGPLPLVGTAGYVMLMSEMLEQLSLQQSGGAPTGTRHIFVGSGSGLTQAGLILGDKVLGGGCWIHGVMLDGQVEQEEHERNVLKAVETAAALFGHDLSIGADDIRCLPGYGADDAAAETKATEAMKLAARSEGLLLDPVYTAKVMAAMIDQIRAGLIPPQDTVVFYHSGGIPAIFSHCKAEAF